MHKERMIKSMAKMFKTRPFVSERPWGYELWTLSTHRSGQSEVLPSGENLLEYLEKEIAKGNETARLTKILFDGQKGVCALDRESHMVELAKGVSMRAGKGIYPQDLEKEEFHEIQIGLKVFQE